MAQLVITAGGAILNAVAFSGSNSLFSMLSGAEAESCNEALAQLQIDREKWNETRSELADWANKEIQRQGHEGHAQQTFRNVDEALQLYQSLTNINWQDSLGPEPTLSNYYQPNQDTKTAEIIGITVGMVITAYVSYRYGKSNLNK